MSEALNTVAEIEKAETCSCGSKPGDGLTPGCNDPEGCGYMRSEEAAFKAAKAEAEGCDRCGNVTNDAVVLPTGSRVCRSCSRDIENTGLGAAKPKPNLLDEIVGEFAERFCTLALDRIGEQVRDKVTEKLGGAFVTEIAAAIADDIKDDVQEAVADNVRGEIDEDEIANSVAEEIAGGHRFSEHVAEGAAEHVDSDEIIESVVETVAGGIDASDVAEGVVLSMQRDIDDAIAKAVRAHVAKALGLEVK